MATTEPILDTMGAVLARWTMGAPAAPAASIWAAELGAEPLEAELRLLALAGQFLGVAVTADPPAGVRALPDIPALELPTLPDSLRPLLRRMLSATKDKRNKTELIHFLAARGWTAHPGDWLPGTSEEDIPDAYAPWRDWAAIATSADTARRPAAAALTAENWDDFWPAARKAALTELRRRDPDAARMLVEGRFAKESADSRLRLLGLMAIRLSDADLAFLENVAEADRAPKVKALAVSLLGRLGHSRTESEDSAELAGFFAMQTKGWLRRTRVIEIKKPATPAQQQRRTVLFESVDIASLARALELAPEELIAAWSWGTDHHADNALIAQIVRSGADGLIVPAAEALSRCEPINFYSLAALVPRMTRGQRAELAVGLLRERGCSFEMAKWVGGGQARLEEPLAAPAGAALLEALGRPDAAPSDQHGELYAVGLLASRAGARETLERLVGAGLLHGDPRLDMLRLNAGLDDNGAKE